MKKLKQVLVDELEEILGIDVDFDDIEVPEPEHGDFAYPCMRAASELGKNSRQIAEEAAEEVDLEIVESVEVAGPGYLNFRLDRHDYAETIDEELGSEKLGVDEREGEVLVEFSSPNVAKPMHIGHFRNNALGDSLQRILDHVGYDVTSENFLGDWGTQYGKVIYAFKEFGSEEEFEQNPMEHMYSLYVKFHEEADDDPEMEEKGREWAKKIEEGDEEARDLWERFRDASMEYHEQEYERMGIEFDRWTGESEVFEGARKLVEEWVEEGKLERDDDGSVFIEFEEIPGTVLLKSDGSTLYITRDLYNLKKRNEEGFDYNIYVVASEQDLHFKQVFKGAKKLGIDPKGAEHVGYGMLHLPGESMSSRKGNIVRLSEVLDKATEKAHEIEECEIGNAAEVGIGAVKFASLSVSRRKDIEFDWEQVLSFDRGSGPYIQYSNTRAKSILEKADERGEITSAIEKGDDEYELLKEISRFPETVEDAADKREPAKIANYLSDLCEEFNTFYHTCPVLDAEEDTMKMRLKVVERFVDVTDQGLELLGIQPLEEM